MSQKHPPALSGNFEESTKKYERTAGLGWILLMAWAVIGIVLIIAALIQTYVK